MLLDAGLTLLDFIPVTPLEFSVPVKTYEVIERMQEKTSE
jgi:hypothetical protein